MYDENQMYDDTIQTLKNTGHDAKSLIDLINTMKNKESGISNELLPTSDSSFVFTGQSTDLRYFQNNAEMPISMIENIPNEELKNAVKDEFNKAALSGKVTIDNKTRKICITESGKKFIELPTFKKAAALDLDHVAISQGQTLGVELDGNVTDLNFFNYADSLDLNNIISHPDTSAAQKILSNFNVLKEQGFININNSIVSITSKGKDLLNTSLFKAASNGVTEKAAAMAGVPGKIFVITKKVTSAITSTAATHQK